MGVSSENDSEWRSFFRSSVDDIFEIIEQSIAVASTHYPSDLCRYRDRLLESLYANYNSSSLTSPPRPDIAEEKETAETTTTGITPQQSPPKKRNVVVIKLKKKNSFSDNYSVDPVSKDKKLIINAAAASSILSGNVKVDDEKEMKSIDRTRESTFASTTTKPATLVATSRHCRKQEVVKKYVKEVAPKSLYEGTPTSEGKRKLQFETDGQKIDPFCDSVPRIQEVNRREEKSSAAVVLKCSGAPPVTAIPRKQLPRKMEMCLIGKQFPEIVNKKRAGEVLKSSHAVKKQRTADVIKNGRGGNVDLLETSGRQTGRFCDSKMEKKGIGLQKNTNAFPRIQQQSKQEKKSCAAGLVKSYSKPLAVLEKPGKLLTENANKKRDGEDLEPDGSAKKQRAANSSKPTKIVKQGGRNGGRRRHPIFREREKLRRFPVR